MVTKAAKLSKPGAQGHTAYAILFIIGLCHLLADSITAVIPAMFPILEESLGLTFTQLGFIAFTLNMISSVVQPIIGMYTDKRPSPYALPISLTICMIGLFGLAFAPGFWSILICVFFIGLGSAIFHPEGSRVAYLAAGPRRGLAQSIYQVGGNGGQALAPVITALILVPLGQFGSIWFTIIAAIAVIFLMYIARWYKDQVKRIIWDSSATKDKAPNPGVSTAVKWALVVLIFLVFARSWYVSAIGSFYSFYVIDTYNYSIAQAQIYIFTFLLSGAIGTFFGGPLADRFGRKNVIFFSLLAPAPLALALPHVGPVVALIMLACIGFMFLSSFSVTVVYAQELVPGKIGTMSGLIVGLAFGMGAIGAVALGTLIDLIGLKPTMLAIAFLPFFGLLTFLLPSDRKVREWYVD